MSTINLDTVNPLEATSTSGEGLFVASQHHSILSSDIQHSRSNPRQSVDPPSFASRDRLEHDLTGQLRASDSEATSQPEGRPTSPVASTSHHSDRGMKDSSSIPCESTITQVDANPDSHQQSLEGILAMIESAVYPHCVTESSPVGSTGSPCNETMLLEEPTPVTELNKEATAPAGEEVIACATVDSEQVDGTEDATEEHIESPPDQEMDTLQIPAKSCVGEQHLGGKKVPPEHVDKDDGAFSDEPLPASNTAPKDEPPFDITSKNIMIIEAPSINEVDAATYIGEQKQQEEVAVSSLGVESPIVTSLEVSEAKPDQEMLKLNDDSDLIDKDNSFATEEPPEEVDASHQPVSEAASPLLADSILTLVPESAKDAVVVQSRVRERGTDAEQAKVTRQTLATGDAEVNSSAGMYRRCDRFTLQKAYAFCVQDYRSAVYLCHRDRTPQCKHPQTWRLM